jgi:Brp/Blh family beta-carotene 15,15'-monooxygenase
MNNSQPLPTIERLAFPVAAFLAIVALALAPNLISPMVQVVGLAIVVIVLGLPHGALDPWIAETVGLRTSPRQSVAFIAIYLSMAVAVVLVWIWLPVASLLMFLLISAWHFSGDWARDANRPVRLCAGTLLLLMPIGFHTQNVAMLFSHLSGEGGWALAYALALPVWLLAGAMVALIAFASWQRQWLFALECLGLLCLAYVATPLIYFALYFCVLHSPRHLLGLFRCAHPEQRPRLLRMTVTYTLATLMLVGALGWVWSALPLDSLVLRLIFIGLAAVTVPHMLLIAIAHVRQLPSAKGRI